MRSNTRLGSAPARQRRASEHHQVPRVPVRPRPGRHEFGDLPDHHSSLVRFAVHREHVAGRPPQPEGAPVFGQGVGDHSPGLGIAARGHEPFDENQRPILALDRLGERLPGQGHRLDVTPRQQVPTSLLEGRSFPAKPRDPRQEGARDRTACHGPDSGARSSARSPNRTAQAGGPPRPHRSQRAVFKGDRMC